MGDYGENDGRSRAEISVAYERALRNMSDEGWSKMEVSEKIADLQAIENEFAEREGRTPAKVEAAAMPATKLGRYSRKSNVIQINQDSLDKANSAEFGRRVETALHEGTHSFQNQAANKTLKKNVNPEMTKEAEAAMKQPYVRPEKDMKAYRDHPAEKQARKEAARKRAEVEGERVKVVNYDKANPQKVNQILVTNEKSVLQGKKVAAREARAEAGRQGSVAAGKEASVAAGKQAGAVHGSGLGQAGGRNGGGMGHGGARGGHGAGSGLGGAKSGTGVGAGPGGPGSGTGAGPGAGAGGGHGAGMGGASGAGTGGGHGAGAAAGAGQGAGQ